MGWTSTADPLSVVQRMSGMMEFERRVTLSTLLSSMRDVYTRECGRI